MEPIKYLDKEGLKVLVREIKRRTSSIYVVKGSAIYADEKYVASEDKVSADIDRVGLWKKDSDGVWQIVEEVKVGWVYNIENDFTTTNDFVDGEGKPVPAGTNIVVASVNGKDDDTATVAWDLLSMNIDLTPYQTKLLDRELEVISGADEYESAGMLPDTPGDVEHGAFAVITAGDDKGAVYRAAVSETLVQWQRIGDQVTVEGALELLGNLAPNTPITSKEIIDAFAD